jgi:cell wall-associated NlpC family hydrolase
MLLAIGVAVLNKLYEPPVPPKPPIPAGNEGKIILEADKLVKITQYIYGAGRNPVFQNNFKDGHLDADCSSFVYWVYKQEGLSLGNPQMQTTYTEVQDGQSVNPVDMAQWKPGDLIFFNENDGQQPPEHVDIYMGGGWAIGAQSTKDGAYAFPVRRFLRKNGFTVYQVRRVL